MTSKTTLPYRPAIAACLLAIAVACGDDGSNPAGGGPGSDTNAPQAIDDLALAYDSLADAVVFTWTARRDDLEHDRAARYDIRYGGSFPFDWEQSSRVANPPPPLAAGEHQYFNLNDPPRGRDMYASMRAIDAAGNESPAGAVAHVRVPGFSFEATCMDPLSGLPIAGLDAVVTSRTAEHRVTGADGRVTLADLAGGTLGVLLSGESTSPRYHTFDDALTLDDNVTLMYTMVPFQQPASPLFSSILSLLKAAVFSPGSDRIIKRWATYPVSWYARDFVNSNGLDYRALTVQATERWNTRLGFQMFAPAGADPAVGVLLEFLPRSTMGSVNGITEYTSDADGYPLHDRIRIVDDFSDEARLYSILMHELGHTIRLLHLPAGFIMYGSQPLPSDISDDEVLMVQLMLALPNGTILDKYDETPPAP